MRQRLLSSRFPPPLCAVNTCNIYAKLCLREFVLFFFEDGVLCRRYGILNLPGPGGVDSGPTKTLKITFYVEEGITLNDLRANPVLQNASFVRANMQGIGHRVTGEAWRELYRLLIARSPGLEEKLAAYAP